MLVDAKNMVSRCSVTFSKLGYGAVWAELLLKTLCSDTLSSLIKHWWCMRNIWYRVARSHFQKWGAVSVRYHSIVVSVSVN